MKFRLFQQNTLISIIYQKHLLLGWDDNKLCGTRHCRRWLCQQSTQRWGAIQYSSPYHYIKLNITLSYNFEMCMFYILELIVPCCGRKAYKRVNVIDSAFFSMPSRWIYFWQHRTHVCGFCPWKLKKETVHVRRFRPSFLIRWRSDHLFYIYIV